MADPVRVLYVDDGRSPERRADALASEHGFDVLTAGDAAARDRLSDADVDCVVVDLTPSDRDGLAFLETAREVRPDLPVVLIVDRPDDDQVRSAFDAGAADCLPRADLSESCALLAHRVERAIPERPADRGRHGPSSSGRSDDDTGAVTGDDAVEPSSEDRNEGRGKGRNQNQDADDLMTLVRAALAGTEDGDLVRGSASGEDRRGGTESDVPAASRSGASSPDAGPGRGDAGRDDHDVAPGRGTDEGARSGFEFGVPLRDPPSDRPAPDAASAAAGDRTTDDRAADAREPDASDDRADAPGDRTADREVESPSPRGATGTDDPAVGRSLRAAAEGSSAGRDSDAGAGQDAHPATDAAGDRLPAPVDGTGSESAAGPDGPDDPGADDRNDTRPARGESDPAASTGSDPAAATGRDADPDDSGPIRPRESGSAGRESGSGSSGGTGDLLIEGAGDEGAGGTEADHDGDEGAADAGPPVDRPGGGGPSDTADGHVPEGIFRGAASSVLVQSASGTDRRAAVCTDLLGLDAAEARNVLLVRYGRMDPSRLARIAADADRVKVIAAGYSQPVPDAARDAVETVEVTNPTEVTRLGIVATSTLRDWQSMAGRTVVCFDSLNVLLRYKDVDDAFRFLHLLLNQLRAAEATAHFHVDPEAADPRELGTIRQLFDETVTVDAG